MTFIGIELDTIAIDNVLKIKNSLKLEWEEKLLYVNCNHWLVC
jgi:hypothetical protein